MEHGLDHSEHVAERAPVGEATRSAQSVPLSQVARATISELALGALASTLRVVLGADKLADVVDH